METKKKLNEVTQSEHHKLPTLQESSIHEVEILMCIVKESRFLCICPVEDKISSLLTSVFSKRLSNWMETLCAPRGICPPNLNPLIYIVVLEL